MDNPVLVPVPAHWTRLLKRRYNQSQALSAAIARISGWDHAPQALVRHRNTRSQGGLGRDERFENLVGSIHYKYSKNNDLKGRDVLLIDDVIASGATLSLCAEQATVAGAQRVFVLGLARAQMKP